MRKYIAAAQAAGCNDGLIYGPGHRQRTMWRMSNGQALIFIAAIVVAVSAMLLLT